MDLWVSFYRFFVCGNPYLALEYCSDVTGGRNYHFQVKIGGQLMVKHKNQLFCTYGCPFIGFWYVGIHIWHQNTAQMSLEVVTTICRAKLEDNWRSNIKINCFVLWVSFFWQVCWNPYLALEYCLDVTGGRNCHLKVKIGGQLEVKHKYKLFWTYGCPCIGFWYVGIHIWHQNTALMSLEVITAI